MPVIRGKTPASTVTAEHRKQISRQLADELSGKPTLNGPVIFEIPLDSSERRNRIDVLVVWDAWKPFESTARTSIILEAYEGRNLEIALALGVTYLEALDQHVLPYAVLPMARRGEVSEKELTDAMIAEGGIQLENGKVDLRLPTQSLAEQVHKRLTDTIPKGYWSVIQSAGFPT